MNCWRLKRIFADWTVSGVVNRLAKVTNAKTWLIKNSTRFWRQTETTFLADSEYYTRRRQQLELLLPRLPAVDRAIDIGCGDGYFTRLFAQHANHVVGYDLSAGLIERARASTVQSGPRNVEFRVGDVDEIPYDTKYDLVICMGVSCCIVDEEKYSRLLDLCRAIVAPDGRLLMVDTVRMGPRTIVAHRNGYVACYRSLSEYFENVRSRGFDCLEQEIIKTWPGLENRLFVWTRSV